MHDFLGLVEQRIDDLIQMSKALENENIRRVDFIHAFIDDKNQPTNPEDGPNLQEIGNFSNMDDEDDPADDKESDSAARVAPVNIHSLRKLVDKKLNKDHRRSEE